MKTLLTAVAVSLVLSAPAQAITPDSSKIKQYKVTPHNGKVRRAQIAVAANRLYSFQVKPVITSAPKPKFPNCHNVRFKRLGEIHRLQFNCSSKAKLVK